MSIPGSGKSIVALLERRFEERFPSEGYDFELATTKSLSTGYSATVSLLLYRVEVDANRRHVDLPPTSEGAPRRRALGLELRYLLTVWPGEDVDKDHEVLERCIDILERDPVLSGDLLDRSYDWEEQAQLKIVLDSLSNEDMMRIWDSLDASYHLSVPYVVRTIPVGARDAGQGADVLGSTYRVGHLG